MGSSAAADAVAFATARWGLYPMVKLAARVHDRYEAQFGA